MKPLLAHAMRSCQGCSLAATVFHHVEESQVMSWRTVHRGA